MKAIKIKILEYITAYLGDCGRGECFYLNLILEEVIFLYLLKFLPRNIINSLIFANYRATRLMKSQVEPKLAGRPRIIINI